LLAVIRDGDADPVNSIARWKDAYWSSHGPDGETVNRAANFGKAATQEVFMRHRSPLFRVDVSGIPAGAQVLAAEFLLVRVGGVLEKERWVDHPNMWVAE